MIISQNITILTNSDKSKNIYIWMASWVNTTIFILNGIRVSRTIDNTKISTCYPRQQFSNINIMITFELGYILNITSSTLL